MYHFFHRYIPNIAMANAIVYGVVETLVSWDINAGTLVAIAGLILSVYLKSPEIVKVWYFWWDGTWKRQKPQPQSQSQTPQPSSNPEGS